MLNNFKINTNALFSQLLNKAFLFAVMLVFSTKIIYCQTNNLLKNNLTFSINTQSLSNTKGNDSAINNFRFSNISVAYKYGIYSRSSYTNSNLKLTHISLSPSIRIGNANFFKNNLNRVLVNFRLGLNGLFITSNKNSILVNTTVFANEDEYTFQDALMRYSGIFIFNRKVNQKFSYKVGTTFTYIFGEPLLLPILGFSLKTSPSSKLNVVLPLNINWRKNSKINKFSYGFSLGANGGINRYQNKLSVDTTNTILILRRRSLQFISDLRIKNKNNTIIFQLGFNANQKVSFTNQNDNAVVNNFVFNGSNSLYANITFLWFLKPKSNREKNENDYNTVTEDEVIDNSWLDF